MAEKQGTKLCKHCKTEIPAGAKVCPNCKKKQGGALKWIVIGVIAVVVIGAAGGNKDNTPTRVSNTNTEGSSPSEAQQSSESQSSSQEEEKETAFKVGETAELNGVQVTMTNCIESEGGQYNKPADGNIFVLAEFEIYNNSEKELSISSMMSFDAYADDYALNYSLTALLEKDGNQLDGTIAAGKKLKGWIGWEVPKDYQNIEVHFTDNVWSNNKFIFLYEK